MIKEILMPAPYGNQNAKKLDTPELRKLAYDSYCDHIAKGKDKTSWYLEEPVELTWDTIEKYIKNDPVEFDPIKKRIAEAKGFAIWEQIVEDSAIGRNKEHNTATLQMKMRCKFGWDRIDRRNEDDMGAAQFNQERLLEQLNARQMIASQPAIQATPS